MSSPSPGKRRMDTDVVKLGNPLNDWVETVASRKAEAGRDL